MTLPKSELRKLALDRRETAFATDPAPIMAMGALVGLLGACHAVAGYAPMRSELEPWNAMRALHKNGQIVCLPVVEARDAPLTFRRWTPATRLVKGAFGAMVPERGEQVVPDGLIVPLVAFDAAGNRLGYGGGFYDRTLEQLRAAGDCTAVGLAYVAQQFDALPQEPTDQRLDAVVTEAGILQPEAQGSA